METNETRYWNRDQQRQKKGSDDPPNEPNQDRNYEARRTYRNVGNIGYQNSVVSNKNRQHNYYQYRSGRALSEQAATRWQSGVVSYTNSETRDLNSKAVLSQ